MKTSFFCCIFFLYLYAYIYMSIQNSAQRANFSRLRQSLGQLCYQIRELTRPFFSDKPVIKGTVYELKRKCSGGQLHSSMVLSSSEGGRTRLRVIPRGSLLEVKSKVERYQRLRRSRSRLVQSFKEMLRVLDEMEEARRQEMNSGDSG